MDDFHSLWCLAPVVISQTSQAAARVQQVSSAAPQVFTVLLDHVRQGSTVQEETRPPQVFTCWSSRVFTRCSSTQSFVQEVTLTSDVRTLCRQTATVTDADKCRKWTGGMGGWVVEFTPVYVRMHHNDSPSDPSTGSEGGLCPAAHSCAEGSGSPSPCPAGTYTNLTGQSLCSRCPAGYFCPEKTDDFTKFLCPPGFYCPDGGLAATQSDGTCVR